MTFTFKSFFDFFLFRSGFKGGWEKKRKRSRVYRSFGSLFLNCYLSIVTMTIYLIYQICLFNLIKKTHIGNLYILDMRKKWNKRERIRSILLDWKIYLQRNFIKNYKDVYWIFLISGLKNKEKKQREKLEIIKKSWQQQQLRLEFNRFFFF